MAKLKKQRTYHSSSEDLKTVLLVAAEGRKTEESYFEFIKQFGSLQIQYVTGLDTCKPVDIIKRIKDSRYFNIVSPYDVWVVLDKDARTLDVINQILAKCCCEKFNLVLTNPKFELWLLLHFVDCATNDAREIDKQLMSFLSSYNKKITSDFLQAAKDACEKKKISINEDRDVVNKAIERAKSHLTHALGSSYTKECLDSGFSEVCLLAERIIRKP